MSIIRRRLIYNRRLIYKMLFVLILYTLFLTIEECVFEYSMYNEPIDYAALWSHHDDAEYFDTIEEALAHCDLTEEFIAAYITEKIVLLQNEKFATLAYMSDSQEDAIYVCKFYTMVKNGEHVYSAPLCGNVIPWEFHKLYTSYGKLDEIGEIREFIGLYNSSQRFGIDETKQFYWGLSQTKNVENLKIEGQAPTDIIPVKLDGETGYFWYYDDLNTDKKPIFKDGRRYFEGEIVITMDEE